MDPAEEIGTKELIGDLKVIGNLLGLRRNDLDSFHNSLAWNSGSDQERLNVVAGLETQLVEAARQHLHPEVRDEVLPKIADHISELRVTANDVDLLEDQGMKVRMRPRF